MAFDVTDVIQSLEQSRAFFYKHLKGLTGEQWAWKPYPECKSVRETLAHMIANDRVALETLRGGKTPEDWERFFRDVDVEFTGVDNAALAAAHRSSHEAILAYLRATYPPQTPLDTEVDVWGGKGKIGIHLGHLSSEDYFHAGQVAFIRNATTPAWEYYKEIYAVE